MIRPLGKNIIVSVQEADKVTSTGIVLKVSIEPDKGVVEAIGDDVTEVKVGDKLFLDWNQAQKIEEKSNKDLYLISIDHVVWVYEDE